MAELGKKEITNNDMSIQLAQMEFDLTPVGQVLKRFEVVQRMGSMFAQSTIVPDVYKNNIGNCAIAVDLAMSMNANPLMVMQNLHIVYGQPSFSSQFLIACVNVTGKYQPLKFELKGDEGSLSRACRVVSYEMWDKERKYPIEGTWVSMKMATDEGWVKRSGSKWQTMPEQMLKYRAAAFWQRTYCPEVSKGLYTREELEEIHDVEYV